MFANVTNFNFDFHASSVLYLSAMDVPSSFHITFQKVTIDSEWPVTFSVSLSMLNYYSTVPQSAFHSWPEQLYMSCDAKRR